MSEAATIGITLQQARDAARNPSTSWVKLHRILCNRQKPTNTTFSSQASRESIQICHFYWEQTYKKNVIAKTGTVEREQLKAINMTCMAFVCIIQTFNLTEMKLNPA